MRRGVGVPPGNIVPACVETPFSPAADPESTFIGRGARLK
jgi:hypothetical protein